LKVKNTKKYRNNNKEKIQKNLKKYKNTNTEKIKNTKHIKKHKDKKYKKIL